MLCFFLFINILLIQYKYYFRFSWKIKLLIFGSQAPTQIIAISLLLRFEMIGLYTWISFPLFSSFHLEKDPTKSQDPVLVDHVYETFNKNLASTQTCVSTVKQKGQNSKLDFQDFGAIRSIIVLLISFQVNSTLWSNYNYICSD